MDLLGLSNRYNFDALQQAISSYLKATLSVNNACVIFNTANFYQLKDLCTACYTYIDSHATEMTSSEGFLSLSQVALIDLLSRDSFFAPEIEIFKAIVQWMEKNNVGVDEARDLLKVVRLQLVSNGDLFNIIRPSGLYQPDQILDALHCQSEKKPQELQQRGLLSMKSTTKSNPTYVYNVPIQIVRHGLTCRAIILAQNVIAQTIHYKTIWSWNLDVGIGIRDFSRK